jgi:selenocysteine-specific elongation factor
MRRLILGTAGHIDHGKTALVRALTGTDTDRLPEEKRRGITIDLGFASLTLPSGVELGIVDVPGHEAFVRNMLAGASGVDIALLVVAADEGVMPQTREHLAILELLGVSGLLVALTKADLAEPDWLALVRDEVAEHLAPGPFADAPIVPCSAISTAGLDTLLATLESAAAAAPRRDDVEPFRMPIDRVFTVQGTGTVVTGTVWSGSLTRDRAVRIAPAGREVRIRGMQVHGCERDRIGPGERAAIALAGLTRAAAARGDTLVAGPGWEPTSMITARVRVLPDARPLRMRQRVRLHLGTAEVLARVVTLDGAEIQCAGEAWAQLRLESPVVARARDRFVLRAYSPVVTIAGGTVVEPFAPKRRRLGSKERAALDAMAGADPDAALLAAAAQAGWAGLALDGIVVRLGMAPGLARDTITRAVAGDALVAGNRLFHPAIHDEAIARLLHTVDRVHQEHPLRAGADRDELRRALPAWAPAGLADAVLDALVADHRLVAEATTVRRPDFAIRLSPDQQADLESIASAFGAAGLAPPAPAELPPALAHNPDLPILLRLLEAQGRLVPIRPDVYLPRTALDDAIRLVRLRLGGQDALPPAAFRDLFGISRRHLLPLLEYLDRSGITRRDGDVRSVLAADNI